MPSVEITQTTVRLGHLAPDILSTNTNMACMLESNIKRSKSNNYEGKYIVSVDKKSVPALPAKLHDLTLFNSCIRLNFNPRFIIYEVKVSMLAF